jgi:hypothetical protein
MKSSTDHIESLVTVVLLTIIISLFVLVACNSNNRSENSNLIPEKQFTSILSDIYLSNGLLTLPEIHDKFLKRDSIDTYIDIIDSYGYTYEAMNNTLKYYFLKKPKRFLRIYDKVLVSLSELEAYYQNVSTESATSNTNQWNGEPSFTFPDPTGKENPLFSRPLNPPTIFQFEVTVVIYPDDPSVNPRLTLWYCNADSSGSGKRTYFPNIKYIKDGQPHTYTIKDTISENHPVVLNGLLFDYEDFANDIYKHARISDISFSIIGAQL